MVVIPGWVRNQQRPFFFFLSLQNECSSFELCAIPFAVSVPAWADFVDNCVETAKHGITNGSMGENRSAYVVGLL